MDTKVAKRRQKNALIQNEEALIKQMKDLHSEIMGFYKKSLEAAIHLGGLLQHKKQELGHSNWIPWVDKYLSFSDRSASNYMKVYTHRVELKKAKVNDLQTAYKLLSNPDNFNRHNRREHTKKMRKQFADQNATYTNPKGYINSVICGNNGDVLKKMIDEGMGGKYSIILSSPPYNSSFYYGKYFDDNKPYKEYLKDLLKVFPLYAKLSRPGSRIIYVVGNVVKNHDRDKGGDYYYPLVSDLIQGVSDLDLGFKLFNQIVWDKSGSKDPLNKQYGTYCSAKRPLSRSCSESILVWSYKDFDLEDIEGHGSDITPEEFEFCSWSIWKISPFSRKDNPHPCSFPPRLIELLLKYYSHINDLVLDPYAGVSTTAQVCKKLHRRFTMVELNGNFCNESVRLLKTA